MNVQLAYPSPAVLQQFLQGVKHQPFAYKEVGATEFEFPKGYAHDRNSVQIGYGKKDFERAKIALQNWQHFPENWTKIVPEKTGIEVDMNVAVLFKLFGLWWINSARIVYVVDEENRYGFAYGTLPEHVEKGEEYFGVELRDDGSVWYRVEAFSRPNFWLIWLGYPIARLFQKRFVRHSKLEMKSILSN